MTIYLEHRLRDFDRNRVRNVEVLAEVDARLCDDLLAELRETFPLAAVTLSSGSREQPADLVILPFTRSLHRRLLREKVGLTLRGLRSRARTLVYYDVQHRRTDVVRRARLPRWLAGRILEAFVIAMGRRLRWRS